MLVNRHKWVHLYIGFTMAVSSFVLIEPSPYDLLMITLIFSSLIFTVYKINFKTVLPFILVLLYLLSNILSLFFINEQSVGIRYSGITFYLAASWICLVSLGHTFKQSMFRVILIGYLLSATIAVLVGIGAYFQMIPMSEEFLLFGRVKSTFKDPNVFGPYLVLPALFAISLTELKNTKKTIKVASFGLFLLLTMGIILSYSRAAWGNFGFALLLYLVMLKKDFLRSRLKTVCVLLLIGLPALLYMIQTPVIQELLSSRLMIKNYDSDRFDTQRAAIETGLLHPFGIGPGHSESVFQYSPHSLYARVFTENGLLGLLSLVSVLLLGLFQSFKSYGTSTGVYAAFFSIVFASLCGLVFNSFFIDTLHWRHFWLVLALAYFPTIKMKD